MREGAAHEELFPLYTFCPFAAMSLPRELYYTASEVSITILQNKLLQLYRTKTFHVVNSNNINKLEVTAVSFIQVKDRSVVKTADFERCCVSPEGLQAAINDLMAGIPKARSFVR